MLKTPAHIEVSVLVHATEDTDKVLNAVQRILPTTYLDDINFQRIDLEGFYGNIIVFFKAKIKKRQMVKAILKNLSVNLSDKDKEHLFVEFERYLDKKGRLYIRLDKQAAYLGKIKFCQADPIHVRITAVGHRKAATTMGLLIGRSFEKN